MQDALNDAGRAVKGSRILVLGAAYKPDISDARQSPAIDILRILLQKGADAIYHDPYIPSLAAEGLGLASVADLDRELHKADCVVIATAHSVYDRAAIAQHAAILVDTRGL